MDLSQYLSRLGNGAVIDPDIIETLTGAGFVPPGRQQPTFAYSAVSFPAYRYSYVRWIERCVCFGILRPNYELLSTQFSGCHLATFTKNGVRYGCHIHCSRGDYGDQRAVWNDYVQTLNAPSVTIFQPDYYLLERYEDRPVDLWGIITPNGRCYSVVVELLVDTRRYPPLAFYNCRNVPKPAVRFLMMQQEQPKPANDLFIH